MARLTLAAGRESWEGGSSGRGWGWESGGVVTIPLDHIFEAATGAAAAAQKAREEAPAAAKDTRDEKRRRT